MLCIATSFDGTALLCGLDDGTLALLAWLYARARRREGMGGGDPKLVAATGAWLGWQALPLMLLLASLGGIIWALVVQRKGDQPLGERRVPFGMFLCGAAFAVGVLGVFALAVAAFAHE